jgi:malate dehydrogenase (oxaloacetate-decarboxylating)
LLQWEDFAQSHAGALLDRYRDQLCTFNDDLQGTAAVTTGALLAAVNGAGGRLRDQRVVILGAGSAGCGIAEQLIAAMVDEGLPRTDARDGFYLVDRMGLLHDGFDRLPNFQRRLVQPKERVASWASSEGSPISLLDVVRHARPTILIGTSGQPGTFDEPVIRAMANAVARPIIFPLSNPTSRVEAIPTDLIEWTDGRAIIATGSPFGDVEYAGRTYPIAQCNNSYVFPGLGLGILASRAARVSDLMLMAAARALADCSPMRHDRAAPLLPPLSQARAVSRSIAVAVASAAIREGLANCDSSKSVEELVDSKVWIPRYLPMRLKQNGQGEDC